MFAELLDRLKELAEEAAAPKLLQTTPRKETYAIRGELRGIAIDAPPRCHQASTLQALIDAAAFISVPEKTVYWHGPTRVVAVLDDLADRRDRVVLPLVFSSQFQTLTALDAAPGAERQAFGQVDFIRLLRIDLGCPGEQVAPFRRLDWSGAARTAGNIQHGRESLGREIEAAVGQADSLPETLRIVVPIYQTAGEDATQPIDCLIDVDPTRQLFRLIPRPGALAEALAYHQVCIAERLREALPGEEDERVFAGSPE
ncbi:MAG TPA: hypothetical protein VMW52_07525 [Phycisphaerae bacterium]|nr:hypothetical protein [Phycisphaerae bacterium]